MKPVKIVAFAAGGLLILAIAAAIAVAMLFDPNKFKGEIERTVKEQKNRTLKIEGDIKLAFWPNLGASLGKVSLSEHNSSAVFASLESAHVSVALLPLLHGQAVVDGVKLAGLRANIVKGKDGKFNFDDLLDTKPAGKPAAKAEPGKELHFDISGVRIDKANLDYRDVASGKEYAVADFSLHTGRIADDVPGKLELSGGIKGKNPLLDAHLDLSGGYRFNLAREALTLTQLEAKGKGTLGKDAFEAKLAVPELQIANDKADGEGIGIDLTLNQADGMSLKASVKTAVKKNLQAKLVELSKLAATITVAGPKLPQKSITLPITGSARIDYGKETVAADIGTKFDESTVQAKLGATAQPAYTFDIDVDRLNVDRYLPPKEPAAKPDPKGDTPVDLSALKGITASGRIHIGALQVQRIKLANLKAEIRAANGALQVAPHSANLYEGTLAGALSLNANGNQVAIKEALANIAIGPLLKDAAERDALDGRGNVTLDVTASGASVNALKRALAGSARVVLKDGAIKGINLAEKLREAKAMLGSKSAQQHVADKGQKTDFSEMSASFALKGGVAHNDDLDVKAPLIRLGGTGDIDIGGSSLNYLAKVSVVASAKGQGGADLSHLNGLTVPVRLTGPFDAPKYEIDFAGVAAGLAKSRIADEVTKAIGGGKAGEKGGSAQDKLRGLFKR